MRTSSNLSGWQRSVFRKIPAIFILGLVPHFLIAQLKDLSTLPAYDCSLRNVMSMLSKPTIIVSAGNESHLENMIEDYCQTFGSNCIRKKESDLTKADFTKNIFLIGIVSDFRKWPAYKFPVKQVGHGFTINGKRFTDAGDGFVYADSTRLAIGGNSLQAIKDAQLALTGGHSILVIHEGKITWFGNQRNHDFNWYNLQDLKKLNYIKKPSQLFSAIYVSKTFTDPINYHRQVTELKRYALQFIHVYKIEMPVEKIEWFIHSNMLEYGTMSGMFALTCPGNKSAGFSIRREIHTNGFNLGLLKHEYSHYLFDNNIPQEKNSTFFVEGCVEYVTNLNDVTLYQQRVKAARAVKDSLDYKSLVVRNRDFYGKHSDENYATCGIFVKYLIDTFGVDSFKKYCIASDKEEAAKIIFKMDFNAIIDGYKHWLDNI